MKKLIFFLIGSIFLLQLNDLHSEEHNITVTNDTQLEKATFAGGCFWCMEPPFDKLDGVVLTTVGYTGGPEENPTYKQVSYGKTGHAEAVEILYDPSKISYSELLDVFLEKHRSYNSK